MLQTFVQVDLDEVKDYVDQHGLDNFTGYVENKMNEWKDIPLNVAVTGSSGVGKSTLINTLRDLGPSDPGAAAVDVTETTIEPTAYCHPDNANLKLWDLPGMGTPRFPQQTYLHDIGYERFDFYLILSSTRFTENDILLAQALDQKQKRFIFVRSKVDFDLMNEHEDHPDLSETQVKEKIRGNIMDNLDRFDIDPSCRIIFLVNCKKRQKLEFDILLEYVIHNLPKIKQEVLLLTLRCLTKEMVTQKNEVLQHRIWKAALLAGAVSAVPIPGLGLVGDFSILLYETKLYMNQLGIDDYSLNLLAREYGTNVPYLRSKIINMAAFLSPTAETIVQLVKSLGSSSVSVMLADKYADTMTYTIPIIGSLIAAPVSFLVTCFILSKILHKVAEDATNVLDAAIKYKATQIID